MLEIQIGGEIDDFSVEKIVKFHIVRGFWLKIGVALLESGGVEHAHVWVQLRISRPADAS